MSELSQPSLEARLDELLKEVRRQGRAAIAAQAAAESCLSAVQHLGKETDEGGEDDEPTRWLRAIIPVADALERVVSQAATLATPRATTRPSFLQRLVRSVPEPADDRAAAALAEGLRVLHAQLEGALRDRGVEVDRRTGELVDGDRQRVVETRAAGAGERAGTVVEVVRPGYALGGVVVREAEVVVAEERSR